MVPKLLDIGSALEMKNLVTEKWFIRQRPGLIIRRPIKFLITVWAFAVRLNFQKKVIWA